ncbi:hypothetical protein PR048_001593 [Dryococelus australis]|uniref:Uncharacterized protein n=1 Tax=Dryococelus australis TaxID=614101 RepID=A0ABQ9IHS7_9NEOP|nr:hypothetical protein PR048_001593 [Dryococelus australis]
MVTAALHGGHTILSHSIHSFSAQSRWCSSKCCPLCSLRPPLQTAECRRFSVNQVHVYTEACLFPVVAAAPADVTGNYSAEEEERGTACDVLHCASYHQHVFATWCMTRCLPTRLWPSYHCTLRLCFTRKRLQDASIFPSWFVKELGYFVLAQLQSIDTSTPDAWFVPLRCLPHPGIKDPADLELFCTEILDVMKQEITTCLIALSRKAQCMGICSLASQSGSRLFFVYMSFADLPWRSRLVRRPSRVQEALGPNPGQGMGISLHFRGRGNLVVRLLVSHQGELGSNPGGISPRFSHVGIVTGISCFPQRCIPALLHTHFASPFQDLDVWPSGKVPNTRGRIDGTNDKVNEVAVGRALGAPEATEQPPDERHMRRGLLKGSRFDAGRLLRGERGRIPPEKRDSDGEVGSREKIGQSSAVVGKRSHLDVFARRPGTASTSGKSVDRRYRPGHEECLIHDPVFEMEPYHAKDPTAKDLNGIDPRDIICWKTVSVHEGVVNSTALIMMYSTPLLFPRKRIYAFFRVLSVTKTEKDILHVKLPVGKTARLPKRICLTRRYCCKTKTRFSRRCFKKDCAGKGFLGRLVNFPTADAPLHPPPLIFPSNPVSSESSEGTNEERNDSQLFPASIAEQKEREEINKT